MPNKSAVNLSHPVNLAIAIATVNHDGQKDWGGASYIGHCARVASSFLNEKYQIVGWLHDIVEDTSVTIIEINQLFGPEVSEAVFAITRQKNEAWNAYRKRVQQNKIARRVKIADLKDNLRRERAPSDKRHMINRRMYFKMLCDLDAKIDDVEV